MEVAGGDLLETVTSPQPQLSSKTVLETPRSLQALQTPWDYLKGKQEYIDHTADLVDHFKWNWISTGQLKHAHDSPATESHLRRYKGKKEKLHDTKALKTPTPS